MHVGIPNIKKQKGIKVNLSYYVLYRNYYGTQELIT
jgi:hypothetical protein